MKAWHSNPAASQALLIVADFGVGKSAFMAELAATGTAAHGLPIAAHHFCDHNTAATLEAATFVRSVAAQLAGALPAYQAAVENDPVAQRWLEEAQQDPSGAFNQAVIGKLNGIAAPTAPLLLLVDGLDENLAAASSSAGDNASSIVDLLARDTGKLPPWLRVLATSRRRQEVRQPLGHAYTCQELDAEQAANLDDILDYAIARCRAEPLASMLATAASTKSPEYVAELLRTKSGGKFLYPVRVLNDLASGSLGADRLEELPPGLDGFYLDAFQRRFPSVEDYTSMGPLLGLLGQAKEPLDRGTLAAILGVAKQRVQQALLRIQDFLRIIPKGQGPPGITAPTYAFDHLSLAQWLTEEDNEGFARAGDFAVDAGAARRHITIWAKGEVAAGRAHEWPYLTRHIAAHLDPADRADVFGEVLLDLPWLQTRLRWADLNALLVDFQWVEGQRVNSLEKALRQGAHVLARHPEQLPVQLLARWLDASGVEPAGQKDLRQQAIAELQKAGGPLPLTASLLGSEALLRTLTGHGSSVSALAVLHDGRLASGSHDGTIKLWDPATGQLAASLEGHSAFVSALAVLHDGRLASGSADNTIKLWDPATGQLAASLEGHSASVDALAVLPDGRLASGSGDATIKLWDPATGQLAASLEGHSGWVNALAALPEGRLASGSWDTNATIELWDPATGQLAASLEGHSASVDALAVLPDGRLASGSGDDTIKLWDPATGQLTDSLEGHTRRVSALAVLPDGRLASGSYDRTIKLWDPATGQIAASLEGHSAFVSALAVLPDGRLASGSWDTTIKLWDPATGQLAASLEGHTDWVNALAVLPDGRLASGSRDRTIKLWDSASGERGMGQVIFVADAAINALAFLPGAQILVTGDQSGRLHWLQLPGP